MNVLIPDNIFSNILADSFSKNYKSKTTVKLSSEVTTKLLQSEDESIALIPSLDLIKHKELYVSSKLGLSFEGAFSNSYFYFTKGQISFEEIFIQGDFSSVEILLSKILFKENYNIEVSPHLLTDENAEVKENLLLVGDKNFFKNRYLQGLSLSEEIIELLSLPFVNYVFASTTKEALKKFEQENEGITEKILNKTENRRLTDKIEPELLLNNLSTVIFEFDNQDIEGIQQLLRLPYYHGIIDDITEVKFV